MSCSALLSPANYAHAVTTCKRSRATLTGKPCQTPRSSRSRTQRRAVVTSNLRDFRPLHHDAITPGATGHFGMIFIPGSYRRTRADTGRMIAALEAILTQYPGEQNLANSEAWL